MKSLIPFIFATITVLGFQNCAQPFDVKEPAPTENFLTDPVFKNYILEFEYYYGSSVAHVPIGFDDLSEGTAGICYRTVWAGKIVYSYVKIDREYWPRMSDLQRINLIFHELGHCALNRDHVESDSVRLCPTSFMHDTVMSTECLKEHYYEYIKEMFP